MKTRKVIHRKVSPVLRQRTPDNPSMWGESIELREVRIMAEAEGYAMVRRKGCMPYVCSMKEIIEPPTTPTTKQP